MKKTNDFVFRDNKLLGDWDNLYREIPDPWHQSSAEVLSDSRKALALKWCNDLRKEYKLNRVIELGCGLGHLTQSLYNNHFNAIGVDASKTAIEKAIAIHKNSIFHHLNFNDFASIHQFDSDIYIMAEITWYVLDELDAFIDSLKKVNKRPVFLIHLLAVYPPNIQKIGVDKFTNCEEILRYFNLEYLEYGTIHQVRKEDSFSRGTYFIARI